MSRYDESEGTTFMIALLRGLLLITVELIEWVDVVYIS
jgi:hypothetical protein